MRVLLFILLIWSCSNKTDKNVIIGPGNSEKRVKKIDSLRNVKYNVTAEPKIFETAFFDGTSAKIDTFSTVFYSVNAGLINIESGRIIACDPIMLYDSEPFVHIFPRGQFPVQLAIAKVNGDERIGFSQIVFSDRPLARWDFALLRGQKPKPIFGESQYGYGVDAGLGLFMDTAMRQSYLDTMDKNDKLWKQVFIDEMSKNGQVSWDYISYSLKGHNLVAFSTGYGDGFYSTYVGYDKDGLPCRLLTDFGLVAWYKK